MSQSVYEALKQGARQKRQKTTQGGPAGSQGSSQKGQQQQHRAYVQCPVCSGSIPAAFASIHAAACTDKASASAAAALSQPQAITPAGAGGPGKREEATPGTDAAPSSAAPPEACAVKQLEEQRQADGAEAAGASPALCQPSPSLLPLAEAEGAKGAEACCARQSADDDDRQQGNEEEEEPAGPSGRATQKASAFDLLLQGSRQAAGSSYTFFLQALPSGGWAWHYWRAGQASAQQRQLVACWSAATSMAGKGGSKCTIHLATDMPPAEGGAPSWADPSLPSNQLGATGGRWRGGPSVLKSALQKCIRLCRPTCAVRCAAHLLKDDPGELLRRLAVICLEDAVLHPGLPMLTWLMAAQAKGYALGVGQADGVLLMVHQLAAVGVRDFLPPPQMLDGPAVGSLQEADAQLPEAEAALVKAVLMRASYGGMAGDITMLKGYAGLWARRFAGHAPPPPLPQSPSLPSGQDSHHQGAAGSGGPAALAGTATEPLTTHAACPAPSHQLPPSTVAAPAADSAITAPTAPTPSAWLQYICSLFAALPVSPALVDVRCVGPLKRSDIPLSAVDFHVSDLSSHLAAQPDVQAVLQELTACSWGAEGDADACLRSCIWLFRSSTSCKLWVSDPTLEPSCSQPEMQALLAEIERDEAHRSRLQPLWAVVRGHADTFSSALINKRFF